jgi:type II secretory pathway component PulM
LARFSGWWRGRTAREQLLLGACAALLAGVAFYSFGLQPFIDRNAVATARLAEAKEIHAWIARAAERARALGPADRVAVPVTAAATPTAIEETLRRRNLDRVVTRLEPTASGIEIDFTGAPLNAVVGWIEGAEATLGYRASNVDFVRGEEPGLVDARLRLTPQASP